MTYTLGQLAEKFSLTLAGDGATAIAGVCSLTPGKPGCISFLSNPKLRDQLAATAAGGVIVGKRDAAAVKNGLIAPDPYLAYARIARLFDPWREFPGDVVHPGAVVAPGAKIGKACCIGMNAVIAEGAVLGDGCFIGPSCIIGQNVRLGAGSRLAANVFVWHGVRIGARCNIQPGAVIGSRGFGNARGPEGWEEVPQLGSVLIGDDVEIGANTCVDRGALEDTVLEDGVRLDNLIQIAHNVHIGAHTAIAACTGIAGSTRIGARCMIGGAVGIAGHLEIADDVIILARAMVTHSLTQKGAYGSGLPIAGAREWRRQVAHVRRLEKLNRRVRGLEKKLNIEVADDGGEGDEPDA